VRAHATSIPFENLDIHLGREIRIDVDLVAAKLVDSRRGGYCFEQNALLAHVLEERGFAVTRLLARVRMGDAVSPRPKTHMTLLVDDHLVDAGFGAATPLGPVPLSGDPVDFGVWTYRIVDEPTPEGFVTPALKLGERTLYTFTLEPRHPVDYVAPNHFTSTHPKSGFVAGGITVQLPGEEVQTVLQGRALREFWADGVVETTIDDADLGHILADRFGLVLPDEDLATLAAS
jgi:N-hydroxyarylamine O-acetyltransferase